MQCQRLSKTRDSCKFLNLLLKGCNAPCVQSTIATKSTPLGRLILLYCADKPKKNVLIKSCNPVQNGYLGL